ncbi:CRISPR-associated protein Cmr5 [Gammaproteobacteria bacterium]
MATLEQQRAQFAWEAVNNAHHAVPQFGEYKNLAKGAPALIMGNGLMAALAFYQSRDKPHARLLVSNVLGWLARRRMVPNDFMAAMNGFFQASSLDYRIATDEALAMLKWLRQFADAISETDAG